MEEKISAKEALKILAGHVASLNLEVFRQKAELWAFGEAMKSASQEVKEALASARQSERYRAISHAATFAYEEILAVSEKMS
jgi:hypothetical protein